MVYNILLKQIDSFFMLIIDNIESNHITFKVSLGYCLSEIITRIPLWHYGIVLIEN